MPKAKERSLLEAVMTNIEIAADSIMANEAVAALYAFISTPDLVTPSFKAARVERTQSTPSETQKIGATRLLVFNRYIDLNKPAVLAKVFVAYIDRVITATDLQRLAQAIDSAFAADPQSLAAADSYTVRWQFDGARHPWMETLIPSGLTASTARGVGGIRPCVEAIPLGQIFRRAAQHVAAEA